jgi:hypothetical protein
VKGSARISPREYVRSLGVARVVATEARFLLQLAEKLELLAPDVLNALEPRHGTGL